jgi:hypothetical protein
VKLTAILVAPHALGADRTPAGAAPGCGSGDFAARLTDALKPGPAPQQPAPGADVQGAPLELMRQPDNPDRVTISARSDDTGSHPDLSDDPDSTDHPDHASDAGRTPDPVRRASPDRPAAAIGSTTPLGTAVHAADPARATDSARIADAPGLEQAHASRTAAAARAAHLSQATVAGSADGPGPAAYPAAAEPGRTAAPASAAEPGRTAPPAFAAEPGRTALPASAAEPGRTAPPVSAAEPGRTAPPASAAEAGRTAAPASAAEPGRTAPPASAAEAGRTATPASAAEPGRTATPAPAAESSRVPAAMRPTAEVAPSNRSTGAATAADAVASLPVGRPYNGMDGLQPTFRQRLERVIDRLEREHGHHVVVTETVRSQERQEWLHAQGRTRPGPVVTWTLNSHHATGRAADLIIDGSYRNPAAYARLAQVAAEEGLHTLGPRDPGHVELPDPALAGRRSSRTATPQVVGTAPGFVTTRTTSLDAPDATSRATAQPAAAEGVARVARIAEVAAPARVAAVAAVAATAEVARVAGPAGRPAAPVKTERRDREPASAATATRTATFRNAAHNAVSVNGERSAASHERAASQPAAISVATGDAAPDGRAVPSSFVDALAGMRTAGGDPLAATVAPVDMAGRIARLMQARDADAARPLSSLLLRVDNAKGGEDRIRVDLRGASLDASLELGDQAAARRADAHLHELRAALARVGLDPQSIRVRAASPEAVDVARAAAAAAEEAHRPAPARPDQTPQRRPAGDDAAPHDDARPDASGQDPRDNQQQGDLT